MMNNLYGAAKKLYCLERIELSWKKYTYEQINHIWMNLFNIEKWTVIIFLKFLLLLMFKIIDQAITIFMGDFFVDSIPCILKNAT